jgi:hypothetical protein
MADVETVARTAETTSTEIDRDLDGTSPPDRGDDAGDEVGDDLWNAVDAIRRQVAPSRPRNARLIV